MYSSSHCHQTNKQTKNQPPQQETTNHSMPLFTYVPMHCSLSIKPLWTRAVALLNFPGVLKSIFGALGTMLVSSVLSVCARQLSSSYSIVRTYIPKETFILQRLKVLLHILDSLVRDSENHPCVRDNIIQQVGRGIVWPWSPRLDP